MHPATRRTAARRTHRPPRAGLATLLLVLALAVLAGFAALAIDLGQLKYVHQQLRTACEAAALAGAAELMDRNVLFPGRGRVCAGIDEIDEHADDAPAWAAIGAAMCDDETGAQVARAARAAQDFAACNYVHGQPLRLEIDASHDSSADIVAGCVDDPSDCRAPLAAWRHGGAVNSLVVRGRLTARRGNAVALWVAKLLGMPTADVAASARASIDRRVYGVRPGSASLAPLVPVAVNYDCGAHSWLAQAYAAARLGRNDCFAIDGPSHYVACGGDGIPEIRLEIGCGFDEPDDGEQRGNARLVGWHEAGTRRTYRPHEAARWIACGVAQDDLAALDGAVLIGQTLEARGAANAAELRELCEALLAARGQTLIWPLVDAHANGGAAVVSLAAGIVVDARLDEPSGRCVVLVQPTVLATSLALASRECPENPWIGKLQLTQ